MVDIVNGQVHAGPAYDAAAVTPNDSADLATHARMLYVGSAGNITLDTLNGSTVAFVAVPVGILNVGAKRVRSTGTTASSIVALF